MHKNKMPKRAFDFCGGVVIFNGIIYEKYRVLQGNLKYFRQVPNMLLLIIQTVKNQKTEPATPVCRIFALTKTT